MLKSLSRKHAYQKHDAALGYLELSQELLRTTIIPSYNHITHGPSRCAAIATLHRLNRAFTETKLFSSMCAALDIELAPAIQSVYKGNPLAKATITRLSKLKPVN